MNRSGFEIDALQIDPTDLTLMPARGRGRGGDYFVKVPLAWVQKLDGAPGQTYRLALHILFLHFRERGAAIILANRTIEREGIPGNPNGARCEISSVAALLRSTGGPKSLQSSGSWPADEQ